MSRADIELCDVFISWTGADVDIKAQIAQYLKDNEISSLLSDEKCQGDFVEWSRSAATAAHIFMTVITENALKSDGMGWELEAIDEKLRSDEKEYWKEAIIPICTDLSLFERYKAKLSPEGQEMLKNLSAIDKMKMDENGMLTEEFLKEIVEKTALRIISQMHTVYREKTKPDYIKLISLCGINTEDAHHPFEKLYIQRKITETDRNNLDVETFETPKTLLSDERISFIYGAAGCGKSQYIHQIRSCSGEDDLVMALSCADISADSKDLLDIMLNDFQKICGNRNYYTKENFIRLLNTKRLILILDGMDEITTKDATRNFVEKIDSYYKSNAKGTTLIFTSRNKKDADVLSFGEKSVRRFRLDKLTDEEIETLGNNLFILFKEEEKGSEFYVSVKDLNDEIRANPLLLSQLAIVYNDSGKIPETIVGILDAVSEITLRADKTRHNNLQTIPEKYKEMVRHDIGSILKQFSREKYEKAAQGKNIEFSKIFNHVLKEKYKEKGDACRERTDFLLEYLRNRAIFTDGKFYHKMFLEYFAAVSYYEDSFDEDYGEIDDSTVIDGLFSHYHDDYWKDVLKLFLVKADSCIDEETTKELYEEILSDSGITEYTLLFEACRDLIVHKKEASLVLVTEILERSANGEYPPYGPLFWYIPEYELYDIAVLAAEKLSGNAKALALVRDVCFIFGRKYTVAEITDEVDGEKLYQAAKPDISGVRQGLVELFCTGKTACSLGTDIYPRCFNIEEAKSFMEYGHGVFGRMNILFDDELGLWEKESYSELGGEYIGFVSCPYDKTEMEQKLNEKPTVKVRGLALSNTENTEMDYVEFTRTSVRVMYIPENTTELKKDFDLFMTMAFLVRTKNNIAYLPHNIKKLTFPNKFKILNKDLFSQLSFLEEVQLPSELSEIGSAVFRDCKNLKTVTIPDSVTKIGSFAFSGCSSLCSITIPDSVTTIDSFAFLGCSSLSSITIPNLVTWIGEYAFARCSSLSSINIPDSVTTIGCSAFGNCSNLSSISIPDSVTEIGCSAFRNCSNLSSISIPDSVTKIGDSAFCDCSSLCSINIPDSVTEIGDSAFKGCTTLCSIFIPHSVTVIGEYTFNGCSKLSNITIPHSVTEIGEAAFKNCTNLSSIIIPDSVAKIGWFAFENCTSLNSITISDSVTWIGRYTFASCSSLCSITIPDSVTEIGEAAFKGCSSLSSINIPDSIEYIGDDVFIDCSNLRKIYISPSLKSQISKFPHDIEIIFKKTTPEDSTKSESKEIYITDGRTEICEREFTFSDIEKIYLPTVMRKIGKNIFQDYCTKLSKIFNHDAVTEIDWYAWYVSNYCQNLSNITIPNSVTKIGYSTFSNCYNLHTISIPNSVTWIDSSAFKGCSSLSNITIPDSVIEIGSYAFKDCTSLISIIIPNSITKIDGHTFEGCSSLSNISIPDSVKEIGDSAFKGCTSLSSISIPNSVTVIEKSAFNGCTNLSSITIHPTVTEIGEEAFLNCSSLTSLDIPKSVRHIGNNAFAGCTALTSVTISANFKNDLSRIFGDIDEKIVKFI